MNNFLCSNVCYVCMTFEPEDQKTAEEIRESIPTTISNNSVVLFIKGTKHMPQCGYSRSALNIIQKYTDDIEVINVLSGPTEVYREVLENESGWETIPQAFVDGEFIGGADILEQRHEQGDLSEVFDSEPTTTPF